MTKVINIFGGPGIGKSGIAAGVYSKMKAAHLQVELVTEVAKDYVWEERFNILKGDQMIVYAKQHRRMDRLRDNIDYIVTDCPLIMTIAYIPESNTYEHLEPLMVESSRSFDNLNFVLERDLNTHTDAGRYHDLVESVQKDHEIQDILTRYNEQFVKVPVNMQTVEIIYSTLCNTE